MADPYKGRLPDQEPFDIRVGRTPAWPAKLVTDRMPSFAVKGSLWLDPKGKLWEMTAQDGWQEVEDA